MESKRKKDIIITALSFYYDKLKTEALEGQLDDINILSEMVDVSKIKTSLETTD